MSFVPFNEKFYLSQYPDVAAAVQAGLITAAEHFEYWGRFEGRSPNPIFNTQDYLTNNPDVAAAVEAGHTTAYDHFVDHGAREGRTPTSLFDPEFYLSQNPDVAAAVEAGHISPVEHFFIWGQNEPRVVSPFIDIGAYLESNPDVAQAASDGHVNPFNHLISHGFAEGRSLGNGINLGDFTNDPSFQAALATGNSEAALARVAQVAPFIPEFEPPAGWTPPANTPIPTDFVPVEGKQLVVPEGIKVPEDVELPETFKPVTPTDPEGEDPQVPKDPTPEEPKEPSKPNPKPKDPDPTDPGPKDPDPDPEDETDPDDTEPEEPVDPVPFAAVTAVGEVTLSEGVKREDITIVSFEGTETGPITLSINEDGSATFERGEYKETVEDITGAAIDTTGVSLVINSAGMTYLASPFYLHGEGDVAIPGYIGLDQRAKFAVTYEREQFKREASVDGRMDLVTYKLEDTAEQFEDYLITNAIPDKFHGVHEIIIHGEMSAQVGNVLHERFVENIDTLPRPEGFKIVNHVDADAGEHVINKVPGIQYIGHGSDAGTEFVGTNLFTKDAADIELAGGIGDADQLSVTYTGEAAIVVDLKSVSGIETVKADFQNGGPTSIFNANAKGASKYVLQGNGAALLEVRTSGSDAPTIEIDASGSLRPTTYGLSNFSDHVIHSGLGRDIFISGMGNDTFHLEDANTGSDVITFDVTASGEDIVYGFRAHSASDADYDPQADHLSLNGIWNEHHLANTIQTITFNAIQDPDATPIDGKTVDVTLDFGHGNAITFVDFIETGTNLAALINAPLSGDADSNGQIDDGEFITIAGITGDELSNAFGKKTFIFDDSVPFAAISKPTLIETGEDTAALFNTIMFGGTETDTSIILSIGEDGSGRFVRNGVTSTVEHIAGQAIDTSGIKLEIDASSLAHLTEPIHLHGAGDVEVIGKVDFALRAKLSVTYEREQLKRGEPGGDERMDLLTYHLEDTAANFYQQLVDEGLTDNFHGVHSVTVLGEMHKDLPAVLLAKFGEAGAVTRPEGFKIANVIDADEALYYINKVEGIEYVGRGSVEGTEFIGENLFLRDGEFNPQDLYLIGGEGLEDALTLHYSEATLPAGATYYDIDLARVSGIETITIETHESERTTAVNLNAQGARKYVLESSEDAFMIVETFGPRPTVVDATNAQGTITYYLGDHGNIVYSGQGSDDFINGAGDDVFYLNGPNTGSDYLSFEDFNFGNDTIYGFRASSATDPEVDDPQADALNFMTAADADDLAGAITTISFTGNAVKETSIDGKSVDVRIDFVGGSSLTFVDFIDLGTSIDALTEKADLHGDTNDNGQIDVGETIVLTGEISGNDLLNAFGADSLVFAS